MQWPISTMIVHSFPQHPAVRSWPEGSLATWQRAGRRSTGGIEERTGRNRLTLRHSHARLGGPARLKLGTSPSITGTGDYRHGPPGRSRTPRGPGGGTYSVSGRGDGSRQPIRRESKILAGKVSLEGEEVAENGTALVTVCPCLLSVRPALVAGSSRSAESARDGFKFLAYGTRIERRG